MLAYKISGFQVDDAKRRIGNITPSVFDPVFNQVQGFMLNVQEANYSHYE